MTIYNATSKRHQRQGIKELNAHQKKKKKMLQRCLYLRSMGDESGWWHGRVSIIIVVNCDSLWIKFITWFEELSSLARRAVGQLTPRESPDDDQSHVVVLGLHAENQLVRRPSHPVVGWWLLLLATGYVRRNKKLITRFYNCTGWRGESLALLCSSCLPTSLAVYRWYTCPVSRRNVWRIVTYEVKL